MSLQRYYLLFLVLFLALLLCACNSINGADEDYKNTTQGVTATVKAMSFNIRVPVDLPPNDWASRAPIVNALINQYHPDIIGFQEMVEEQQQYLLKKNPLFSSVGSGRNANLAGEACPIFVNTKHWTIDSNEQGTFWYSDTPNVPGSSHWGNQYLRIATWAKLNHNQSDNSVYVFNTHWDFDELFQNRAATLLLEKINQRKSQHVPVIIMGDFNAIASNNAIKQLLSNKQITFIDSWSTNAEQNTTNVDEDATFHGFSGNANQRIDYIFTANGADGATINIEKREILRQKIDDIWPSDHFPLYIEFTLSNKTNHQQTLP
ncbi:endonuclease/exonuclease/phosphatase family protein [Colwelliaceae bacterium BS250]